MGRITSCAVAALLALCVVRPCDALMMFDAPRPLASNAATDDPSPANVDVLPAVAGDGTGNWVALWSSNDSGVGVHPGALGQDAVFSRSVDDGVTWSPVAVLNSDALEHDAQVRSGGVATNGEGTWIAILHGDVAEVEIVRSIDGGSTWSDPMPFDGLTMNATFLRIVPGADGKWIAMWRVTVPPSGWPEMLVLSQSVDDGITWSTPTAPLLDDGWYAGGYEARLVTDRAGTWIVIWCIAGGSVFLNRSTDDAASWGVGAWPGGSDPGYVPRPDLATDGAGTWIAVWDTTSGVKGADPGNFTDWDIVASRSTDNGRTWSEASAIGGVPALTDAGDREDPRIRYDHGVWQVVWMQAFDDLGRTIGQEGDLVGVRSFDGGVSWTEPAAMNVNAARDNSWPGPFPWPNLDWLPDLETAANGTSILAWTSTNSLGNTIGNDYDVFYARSHNDCPTAPMQGCRIPATTEASTLFVRNPVGGRDKLLWKWRGGSETLLSDLGDPTSSTSYALCLYDKAGGALRNVLEIDAAAASQCATGNCWTTSEHAYSYQDRTVRNGPLRSLRLTFSSGGRFQIRGVAVGAALAPPVMPLALDPSAIMQLINLENGQCWQASFASADVNTSTEFRGRSN